MLDTLITSKTRIKLLVKFFLNASTRSYLRDLEVEFGESTNGIRIELNRFEEAGMLISHFERNKKIFSANTRHPLFNDIHHLLMKYTGIDEVVQSVLTGLGGLEKAWLIGSFAKGKESDSIELLLAGSSINIEYLVNLVDKAQRIINRSISYTLLKPQELDELDQKFPERLLLYNNKP